VTLVILGRRQAGSLLDALHSRAPHGAQQPVRLPAAARLRVAADAAAGLAALHAAGLAHGAVRAALPSPCPLAWGHQSGQAVLFGYMWSATRQHLGAAECQIASTCRAMTHSVICKNSRCYSTYCKAGDLLS